MPSLTKMASYHSAAAASPRLKGQHYHDLPLSTTATTTPRDPRTPHLPTSSSTPTSIPSLPDVAGGKAARGPDDPWNFLYTLLEHANVNHNTGSGAVPGRRRTLSAGKVDETEPQQHAGRGERRRLSRETDYPSSRGVLPGSGSGSSSESLNKKMRVRHHRLSQSYDFKPAVVPGQRRRFSSPVTTRDRSGSEPDRGGYHASVKTEAYLAARRRVADRKSSDSAAMNGPTYDDGVTGISPVLDTINDNHADSVVATPCNGSDRHRPQQAGKPTLSSTSPNSPPQDTNQASTGVDKKTTYDVSHWTTCRALEDSSEDSEETDGEDAAREEFDPEDAERQMSEDCDQAPRVSGEGGAGMEGLFSRATSSNPARRKRPLMLPPIMLPPVHTAKPTPLKLRDEPLYYMGARPRARRPVSDEEWDKLWDCRYLRIRTIRRPLKA